MQNLKSISPVNIYKSASAIYMTSLEKVAPSAFNPTCTTELAIEEAIALALNESISPNVQVVEENNEQKLELDSSSEQDHDEQEGDYKKDLLASSRKRLSFRFTNNQTSKKSLRQSPAILETFEKIQESAQQQQLKQFDEYLFDDDEEEDLLMSSKDRSSFLQSKYDSIVQYYEKVQKIKIPIEPKQGVISVYDMLLLVFCLISICISAYVIVKDVQNESIF